MDQRSVASRWRDTMLMLPVTEELDSRMLLLALQQPLTFEGEDSDALIRR